jgi:hypothetical protein
MKRFFSILRVSLLALLVSVPAMAQATRTWVSGVGDDVNPCSRTAPCKTFAGAISKTAAGGEIDALDPGGFGAVTITKAITIDGMGTFASILSAGTFGIIVNAGASDVVTIRGLSINGAGTGLAGIRFLAGAALHVEDTVISGLTGFGIDFEPTTGGNDLFVSGTKIRRTQGGIKVKPGGGTTSTVTLERCELSDNTTFGIRVEDNVVAVVNNTVANGNLNGFLATTTTGISPTMTLDHCVASHNSVGGISAGFGGTGMAVIVMSETVVTNNATGLRRDANGAIDSFGNNRIAGNATDGTPSAPFALQ